jgi:hypothetical protein
MCSTSPAGMGAMRATSLAKAAGSLRSMSMLPAAKR